MSKQELKEELKQAMLDKEELKTSVLRLLLSAVNYYEIEHGGAGYEANDEDVVSVIQTQVKQRRDSIEQFSKAGRKDLADKETRELEILKNYLPEQISEEEITNLVKEVVAQTGAKSMADMGKVMGVLMPRVKGKADGNLVSKIVREELSKIS